LGQLQAALVGGLDDGCAEGMLAAALQARSQAQPWGVR